MSNCRPSLNVRRAARWVCDNMPITWERGGKRRRRPGFLHDISEIGLSYLIAMNTAPKLGDHVTVTPRRTCNHIAGRVVRVTKFGKMLCLVGCERLDLADSQLMPLPAMSRRGYADARRTRRQLARAA